MRNKDGRRRMNSAGNMVNPFEATVCCQVTGFAAKYGGFGYAYGWELGKFYV